MTQPSPAPNQKPRKMRSTLPSKNLNKQIFAYQEGLETLSKGGGEKKNLYERKFTLIKIRKQASKFLITRFTQKFISLQ